MLSISYRTAIGTIILLILPILVWISGWKWYPGQDTECLKVFYWITETVTQLRGVIIHNLLFAWFLWHLRFCLRSAIILFVILSSTILVGQSIKSLLKDKVQEPRPFILWLEEINHIPVNKFYNLDIKDRNYLIKTQLQCEYYLPEFLRKYWQKEVDFAFPSGHTIFASSWALLSIGLLWPRRHIVTIVILLVWAIGVMSSRLLLGMHWPQDLVIATLISWILVILATWLSQCLCEPFSPLLNNNNK